jgi:hypothetical protein
MQEIEQFERGTRVYWYKSDSKSAASGKLYTVKGTATGHCFTKFLSTVASDMASSSSKEAGQQRSRRQWLHLENLSKKELLLVKRLFPVDRQMQSKLSFQVNLPSPSTYGLPTSPGLLATNKEATRGSSFLCFSIGFDCWLTLTREPLPSSPQAALLFEYFSRVFRLLNHQEAQSSFFIAILESILIQFYYWPLIRSLELELDFLQNFLLSFDFWASDLLRDSAVETRPKQRPRKHPPHITSSKPSFYLLVRLNDAMKRSRLLNRLADHWLLTFSAFQQQHQQHYYRNLKLPSQRRPVSLQSPIEQALSIMSPTLGLYSDASHSCVLQEPDFFPIPSPPPFTGHFKTIKKRIARLALSEFPSLHRAFSLRIQSFLFQANLGNVTLALPAMCLGFLSTVLIFFYL